MSVKFKKDLTALLQSHIAIKNSLPISWPCAYCRKEHESELFAEAAGIELDVILGEWKADIALLDDNKQTFAVVFISKNKKTNAEAAAFYQTQNITYIQVKPVDDALFAIRYPLFVGTCLNPKCEKCGGFQHEKHLVVIDSACWKCESEIKIAVLECGIQCLGPDEFTEDELTLARKKGTIIQMNYSNVVRDSYLSNTCPNCKKLTGGHYLWEYLSDTKYGDSKFERIPLGYFCEACYRNDLDITESL